MRTCGQRASVSVWSSLKHYTKNQNWTWKPLSDLSLGSKFVFSFSLHPLENK